MLLALPASYSKRDHDGLTGRPMTLWCGDSFVSDRRWVLLHVNIGLLASRIFSIWTPLGGNGRFVLSLTLEGRGSGPACVCCWGSDSRWIAEQEDRGVGAWPWRALSE